MMFVSTCVIKWKASIIVHNFCKRQFLNLICVKEIKEIITWKIIGKTETILGSP